MDGRLPGGGCEGMWLVWLAVLALGGWAAVEGLYYLTHRRPLTDGEVFRLAAHRRRRTVASYFRFARQEVAIHKAFKAGMKPSGRIYAVNERLEDMPDLAAALLKGKKHEWMVIAFERGRRVTHLYVNKGPDNESVSLLWEPESIVRFARQQGCTSLLLFHNHPNPNPGRYDFTRPSGTDLESARQFAGVLLPQGINLIEFVCERGRHYRYFDAVSEHFLPVGQFSQEIRKANGTSPRANYRLHRELRRRPH